jgi:hypothetical protein
MTVVTKNELNLCKTQKTENMKKILFILFVAASVIIASCGGDKKSDQDTKKNEDSIKAAQEKKTEDSAKAVTKSFSELDKQYKEDKNGQWADRAEASSSYAGNAHGKMASWSADQMTGKPDVETYGDNGNAWASMQQDQGDEWVKLTFKKPVFATEVHVRMTYNPGAISKIEVLDQQGKSETVWQGKDKESYKQKMGYFVATFEKTKSLVNAVKITLDSKAIAGWNEIDAVQLIGTEK